ncbi:hypothetical protein [Nitrosovibrio sp. Nv6]|uniref:hypothetical protein n=1 Tax=Nitrosovibrio sp. Nv6 TaxID=1855340 RepID=UPI0008D7C89A|nr:hypothetical protein [Nitrosovibrio sp. Nv6]SEO78743.1 hypothetical protein SAMN05216316_1100 [Nitrosovibrio sp. Nv6]
MTGPFKFVASPISHDTVEALEMLLDGARRGDVSGLAYTFTDKKKKYRANTTGLLYESPAFAIGTVVVLLYRLVMRAIGREK